MQRHCLARRVALLAEGVDRNSSMALMLAFIAAVALLAEGVDRNVQDVIGFIESVWSPSSRRAWIEIFFASRLVRAGPCRPPRGGRG